MQQQQQQQQPNRVHMQKAKVKSRQEVVVVVVVAYVVFAFVVPVRAELPSAEASFPAILLRSVDPAKNQKGSLPQRPTVYKSFSCFDNINLLSLPCWELEKARPSRKCCQQQVAGRPQETAKREKTVALWQTIRKII